MNELWEDDDDDLETGNTRPIHTSRSGGAAGSNLYLLTGLLLGLMLGLLYAWVISPIRYSDIAPASLSAADQDQYRKMIALAYSADQDLPRARERLKLVSTGDAQQALVIQAQRLLAEKKSAQEARALAVLAAALSQPIDPPVATTLPAVLTTPTASPTPQEASSTAAQAPAPPATQTAASIPAGEVTFTLKNKQEICDGSIPPGQMQIQVNDRNGTPLPGIKIVVTWQDGEDTFYTGLTPQVNPGYADFEMSEGRLYQVQVGEAGEVLKNIKYSNNCGWIFEFSELVQLIS